MHLRTLTTITAWLLLATTALAEPDSATKAKARDMGLKGLSLYDNGDYAGALAQFDQAYAMYTAPTLAVYAARALAKLGRLTEASARYLQVTRMTLPKDASEQFRQAQSDAETERAALIQRIPRLRVEVAGGAEATSVTVDGAAVAAADLTAGVTLNPGAHDVRGQRAQEVVTMNVALQEGETKTVTLEFKPAAAPEVAPPPAAPTAPVTTAPPMAPLRDTSPQAGPDPGSGKRTLGWVLLGVGGVGLGVGAVTGLMATGKKSDLEKVCHPNIDHCPESSRTDVDQYNTLRTVSTVGFIAGGVGLAGGALLLLTAPSASGGERSARVTPWVGVGSVGMRGRF